MQFDVGRGTAMRLAQIDVQAPQLDAVFFTHMHSALAQGTVKLAGGALTADDYRKAGEDVGFTGKIVVGTDLASVRLPLE